MLEVPVDDMAGLFTMHYSHHQLFVAVLKKVLYPLEHKGHLGFDGFLHILFHGCLKLELHDISTCTNRPHHVPHHAHRFAFSFSEGR